MIGEPLSYLSKDSIRPGLDWPLSSCLDAEALLLSWNHGVLANAYGGSDGTIHCLGASLCQTSCWMSPFGHAPAEEGVLGANLLAAD